MIYRGMALRAAVVVCALTSWAAARNNSAPLEPISDPRGQEVDKYLSRCVPFGFSGQVCVVRDGQVIISRSYGLADREKGRPINNDTVFAFGSLSKPFTATAVMLLVSEKKLETSDAISKFFPNVPQDKAGITIDQLLAHTSGLPGQWWEGNAQAKSMDEAVANVLSAELQFAPGAQWNFSDAGYTLLAAIIEKTSGESYAKFMNDHVFAPAKLSHTLVLGDRKLGEGDVAFAYHGWEKTASAAEWNPGFALTGGGSIAGTADDLGKWMTALESGSLLAPEYRADMLAQHTQVQEGIGYGYGFFIDQSPQFGPRNSLGGDAQNSYNGCIFRYPDDKITIALLSNQRLRNAMWARWFVQGTLEALVQGQPLQNPPPEVTQWTAAQLKSVAGEYRLPAGGRLRICPEGDGAYIGISGQEDIIAINALPAELVRDTKSAMEKVDLLLGGINDDPTASYAQALGVEGEPQMPAFIDEWKGVTARLGKVLKWEVLGAIPRGDGTIASFTRIEFEKGVEFMRHQWLQQGEGHLFQTEIPDGSMPLALRFAPESDSSLVHFSLPTQHTLHLRLERDADGKPTAVTLVSPIGETRAERVEAEVRSMTW